MRHGRSRDVNALGRVPCNYVHMVFSGLRCERRRGERADGVVVWWWVVGLVMVGDGPNDFGAGFHRGRRV